METQLIIQAENMFCVQHFKLIKGIIIIIIIIFTNSEIMAGTLLFTMIQVTD